MKQQIFYLSKSLEYFLDFVKIIKNIMNIKIKQKIFLKKWNFEREKTRSGPNRMSQAKSDLDLVIFSRANHQ